LYTGDLLPDDRDEAWVQRPRQQLIGLRLTLLLELAELQAQRGEIAAAMETLQQVVAIEPVHEGAHAKLMRLLAQAGYRSLALRQFGYLVGALRRELGTGPDPSTRALYHQILMGATTPDLSPGAERPGRLPLVGHDRERRHLQAWLDRLCAGRGGLLFVRGEAGAGKSRLCADLIGRAALRGVIMLTGEIPSQETSVAYRPIAMALEGYARGVAAGGSGAQLADMSSRLAGLWQACLALLDRDQPASSLAALNREHLLPAITDFFKSLCTTAPVLVLLDDLHLAGEAGIDLLQYLAGLAQDLRLLLVAAYRPEEAAGTLSSLVFKLMHEGLAGQLDVPRLDFEATALLVTALFGGPADHALMERIYTLAGGNPYFTEEAVQALRGRGQIARRGGMWRLQAEAATLPNSLHLRRRGNP
jgi:hypothetical protein